MVDAPRHLTMSLRTRSNTPLFHKQTTNEENLPTVQDAALAASRISRAQPNACRSCRAGRPTRQGPQAPRSLSPAARGGVAGRAKRARFGFAEDRRLSSSEDFERLLREGRRETISGFTFYYARRRDGSPRLGILVSRRHAKKAIERNSLKRCIREAFRLEQGRMAAIDVLVRPAYGSKPGAALIARLRPLFAKLAQ